MKELNELALEAAHDDSKFESLVLQYRAFILKCASKHAKKYVTISDDEWSVALLAFSEAVHHYQIEKGAFLPFCELVIQRRLLDHFKSNQKFRIHVLSPAELQEDDENFLQEDASIAIDNFQMAEQNASLKDEIEAISVVFEHYGFRFFDLVDASPKACKTKNACIAAISYILKSPDMMRDIKRTKQLPIKILSKNLRLPRKILDRHRKYIIASVEILSGEYPYLSEYMWPIRKELCK